MGRIAAQCYAKNNQQEVTVFVSSLIPLLCLLTFVIFAGIEHMALQIHLAPSHHAPREFLERTLCPRRT